MIWKLELAWLVAMAAVGARLCAAEVPGELRDCRIHRLWEFDTDAGGWVADHNVSPFKISNGILSFTNTGSDPWIMNHDLGAPETADYHFLGVKMRSSKAGANQVYFATDVSPGLSEEKVLAQTVVTGDKFRFYELDLSQLKTWTGKLTCLRIDTANSSEEVGAKIDIDWIALYQRPARLTLGRPYAGEEGTDTFVCVPIKNTGGEAFSGSGVVQAGGREQRLEKLERGETATFRFRVPPGSGDIIGSATVDDKSIFDFVLVSPYEKESGARELSNERTLLQIPTIKPVNRCGLSARLDERLCAMAVLRPLATLACRKPDGSVSWVEVSADSIESADEHGAVLRSVRKVGSVTTSFTWTFELKPGDLDGSMSCELTTDSPLEVLRFEGPRMLAGEGMFGASKTHAVFPGLEYLEKDEPSSAVGHVGPKIAERCVPHPYKVTVPVVAVEAQGGVVGLWWNPMGEWARGKPLVCAQFQSPNRSEGAKNHLMSLFAPSIPDYLEENSELATTPYVLKPGETMKIAAHFFAREGEGITEVVPNYFASRGAVKPPPVAHGVDGTIDLCLKAYTESLFSAEAGGWKSHFGIGDKHTFRAHYAADILAESLRCGEHGLARKCKLDPNAQLTQYLGTSLDWFSPGYRAGPDAAVARQSEDGGFGYQISEQTRKTTANYAKIAGVETDLLGELGSTNSGLVAREIIGILSVALKTGEARYADAGIKGLEKMNSFTVPRGAQTWEVHAHTPDIYAAGLCVDANILGYHLTGDAKYLDHARFWAYTGLPMVYSWAPPIAPIPAGVLTRDEQGEGKSILVVKPQEFFSNLRRRVNPGATIPVLGSTFYVTSWFGVPVQWCGLAWANAVRHYTRLRPDPVLESVADAVFASATQQQLEKGYLAGTYPDTWNLLTNTATMAFIGPDLVLEYAYALKGEKKVTSNDQFGFETDQGRALFNTFAQVVRHKVWGGRLEIDLKFFGGQDVYSCVSRSAKPVAVSVDGTALPAVDDILGTKEGYFHDGPNHALHVKYRRPGRNAALSIAW